MGLNRALAANHCHNNCISGDRHLCKGLRKAERETTAFYYDPFGGHDSRSSSLLFNTTSTILLSMGVGKIKCHLTSSVTGPGDGVASPLPFAGVPLLHLLDYKSVARPGARGVRWHK